MNKIYRNIYFQGNSISSGKGDIVVYYTGLIFNNARFIKDFKLKYDPTKDLYIICNSCASKKYGKFIKIKK